mgnify:CR=1 FL=1
MSGGHFDYEDMRIYDIACRIKKDIRINNQPNSDGYCVGWKPETMEYVKALLRDVIKIHGLLHEYDWAISDDSCEDEFLQVAKQVYGETVPKVADAELQINEDI